MIFREVQRFTQLWLWVIVLGTALLSWYGAIEQLVYGHPYGNNPASDQGMFLVWILTGILLPLFILSIRFVIEIRNSGIYVKFFPLHLSFKHFSYEDIISYKAITYRPLLDYGGWGIRYASKGKAYNIKGNKGLLLEFKDGRHLLLGSQEPDILKMSVDQAKNRV
ncbi:MAG: DUF6141 family protein [Methanolobus sp.]